MSSKLEIVLAVVGTGVALAALIMAQSAGQRREIGDLRKEMHQELGGIRERLARLEGVIDIIRIGMVRYRRGSFFRPVPVAPGNAFSGYLTPSPLRLA